MNKDNNNSWRATETIARLEQRNAIRAGKFISMINTRIVQGLSMKEKKEFFEYLKSKGRMKTCLLISSILMFVLFVCAKFNFTGNVISIEEKVVNYISILSVSIFGLAILILLIISSKERKINRLFDRHVKIAETISSGKNGIIFKGRSTRK